MGCALIRKQETNDLIKKESKERSDSLKLELKMKLKRKGQGQKWVVLKTIREVGSYLEVSHQIE